MSTEWRHRPSLQALISRKQRKMIIAKSRLMTIAILGAIFGQTKKASPQPLPKREGLVLLEMSLLCIQKHAKLTLFISADKP